MLEIIGYTMVLLVALVLICIYPLTELARGMASNPSAHDKSRGSCIASLIGLALLGWWIWEMV